MKKHVLFIIILLQTSCLFAQLSVSNVSFSQRTDGSLIVDIYYDLSDADSGTKTVSVEASDDDGATWTLNCTSLTGDLGTGISLGTGKHIVWDFYADNPNQSGSEYKVRVNALDEIQYGTMTGNDGKTYTTVKIGDQWWMAENLKETQYRNGNAIDEVTDNATWEGLSAGARCSYNNSETNANTYGYLYNWYAVDDSRNIAPVGWHVPTDAEWKELEMALGMSQSEVDDTGWRGTNEGSQLAGRADLWYDGALENNAAFGQSGYSALPAGYRYGNGSFYYLSSYAIFWSATEYDSYVAWYRLLFYYNSDVYRSYINKHYGFSVRLVRD